MLGIKRTTQNYEGRKRRTRAFIRFPKEAHKLKNDQRFELIYLFCYVNMGISEGMCFAILILTSAYKSSCHQDETSPSFKDNPKFDIG